MAISRTTHRAFHPDEPTTERRVQLKSTHIQCYMYIHTMLHKLVYRKLCIVYINNSLRAIAQPSIYAFDGFAILCHLSIYIGLAVRRVVSHTRSIFTFALPAHICGNLCRLLLMGDCVAVGARTPRDRRDLRRRKYIYYSIYDPRRMVNGSISCDRHSRAFGPIELCICAIART